MIRWWGGVVWALVGAMAAAVAVQAVLIRDAAGDGRAAFEGGLQLNEILAGPARDWDGDSLYDSRSDEWIEVRNAGASIETLEGYRLADADRTVRVALSGRLPPGGIALVTGSAAVAWQRSQGLTASGLSLNNAGDTVFLLRVAGTDTTIVDSRTYGSIEGGSDRSVGRSTGSGEWMLFDSLNRYTGSGTPGGTGCAPTPGSANECATTGVESTTWGAIKRLYR